jgi:hypothetical protein
MTWVLATAVGLLVSPVGCASGDGPELGLVTGKVTLDGKPLRGALVVFAPRKGGRQSSGLTDSEGRYDLAYLRGIRGAVVGPHRVRISTAREDKPEETVPSRYNAKTKLVAEIRPGENALDFALEP